MTPKDGTREPRPREVIGWRELIGLPEFGIDEMRAKIDTGARTSALHATRLETFDRDGQSWVRFRLPFGGLRERRFEAAIRAERDIKNTSGVPERRLIIQTTLRLGRRSWRIEASLADRERMEFDLILGRTALRRRRLLIDPGRSFAAGSPRPAGDASPDAVRTDKPPQGGRDQ